MLILYPEGRNRHPNRRMKMKNPTLCVYGKDRIHGGALVNLGGFRGKNALSEARAEARRERTDGYTAVMIVEATDTNPMARPYGKQIAF